MKKSSSNDGIYSVHMRILGGECVLHKTLPELRSIPDYSKSESLYSIDYKVSVALLYSPLCSDDIYVCYKARSQDSVRSRLTNSLIS